MIYIGLGGGVRLPSFLASWFDLLCSSTYTYGRQGAIPDSSQFSNGSGWKVPWRCPDYAERAHVVLSREGGPTSLGPWVLLRETVTRVGPDVDSGTQ